MAVKDDDGAPDEGEASDRDSAPDSDDSPSRDPVPSKAETPAKANAKDEGKAGAPAKAKAEPKPKVQPSPAKSPGVPGGDVPVWVVPAYVGGLVLFYVGERVLAGTAMVHWAFSGLGVAAIVVSTVARFNPAWRKGGERREIEGLMAALSVLGLVALALYAATTEWGAERFGIAARERESRESILTILTISWVSLIALSAIPMIFAEAALLPMRKAPQPESRRVRAAAASGFAVAMAAVYGSLFVYAAGGADVTADYSYFKTSRPSTATRRIAESLNEPVQVTAFFPQVNEVRVEVERYLKDLASNVPNLQVSMQDRLLAPKLANDLRATQDGVVVIAKGEVNKRLTIGAELKSARDKLKTLDRDFQEQLLKIVRSRRTAYMTVGHGEINDKPRGNAEAEGRTATIIRKLLEKQNYVVKNLGVAQGLGNEIPTDADIVFVLGPSEPFMEGEVDTLSRYALQGGKLFLALDPDAPQTSSDTLTPGEARAPAESGEPAPPVHAAPSARTAPSAIKPAPVRPAASAKPGASAAAPIPTPPPPAKPLAGLLAGLDALARVAGLEMRSERLTHDRQHLRRRFNDSDRAIIFSNRFSSHASVSTLSQNSSRAAVVVSGSGAVQKAAGGTESVDFAVRTISGTFGDLDGNFAFDSATEKRDQFNIAAAVSRSPTGAKPAEKKEEGKKTGEDKKEGPVPPDEMRAFVVADADAFTDPIMANVVSNQVLFVDAVRWMGGEESFAGEETTEEDVRIEHTKAKDQVWFYSTIFGIPAMVLGGGLAYSRRSRRRGKGSGS